MSVTQVWGKEGAGQPYPQLGLPLQHMGEGNVHPSRRHSSPPAKCVSDMLQKMQAFPYQGEGSSPIRGREFQFPRSVSHQVTTQAHTGGVHGAHPANPFNCAGTHASKPFAPHENPVMNGGGRKTFSPNQMMPGQDAANLPQGEWAGQRPRRQSMDSCQPSHAPHVPHGRMSASPHLQRFEQPAMRMPYGESASRAQPPLTLFYDSGPTGCQRSPHPPPPMPTYGREASPESLSAKLYNGRARLSEVSPPRGGPQWDQAPGKPHAENARPSRSPEWRSPRSVIESPLSSYEPSVDPSQYRHAMPGNVMGQNLPNHHGVQVWARAGRPNTDCVTQCM
jgi:hypothetical protein